jgi:hypothetical protein
MGWQNNTGVDKGDSDVTTKFPPPKKRDSALVQLLVGELKKEMQRALAKAVEELKASTENTARAVAQGEIQAALEAYRDEDLEDAIKDVFSSSVVESEPDPGDAPLRRRLPRSRLSESDAKPGIRAAARVGHEYRPVLIAEGPFMVDGRALYKVERLTPGKNFTGGMKPLTELYELTEDDNETIRLSSSSPPASSPRKR